MVYSTIHQYFPFKRLEEETWEGLGNHVPSQTQKWYIIISLSIEPSLTITVDYILTKFPKGYKLFCHKKGVNHDIDRTDAYLYSMCSFLTHTHTLNANIKSQ